MAPKAAGVLLTAQGISGEAYNCCDRYISEFDVATLAKELSGSQSQIIGKTMPPKHQIVTENSVGRTSSYVVGFTAKTRTAAA